MDKIIVNKINEVLAGKHPCKQTKKKGTIFMLDILESESRS